MAKRVGSHFSDQCHTNFQFADDRLDSLTSLPSVPRCSQSVCFHAIIHRLGNVFELSAASSHGSLALSSSFIVLSLIGLQASKLSLTRYSTLIQEMNICQEIEIRFQALLCPSAGVLHATCNRISPPKSSFDDTKESKEPSPSRGLLNAIMMNQRNDVV